MEEISKQTQTAEQSDLFLDGLEDPPATAEQTPAAQEAQSDETPAGDGGAADTDMNEIGAEPAPVAPAARSQQVQEADIQADLASFAAAFPEGFAQARDNPQIIPQCVWDMMQNQGLSLTAAYARYTTAQIGNTAGNQSNAARSTGSMRSAGSDAKNSDPFLSAFEA